MTAGGQTATGRTFDWATWRRRQGWSAGVWVLLVVLIGWYMALIPRFGSFQIASIAKNSLPLVYLAIGQAVIVIAGGIDLALGAMLVLTNSVAAQLMDGRPLWLGIVIAVGIIAAAGALNGLVGAVINASRIPDIVVTLAMSFVYSGLALMILPGPGGGTAPGFRWIFTGSASGTGSNFIPSLAMLVIPTVVVALLMRRTRTGLSLYAVGSDLNASYLSGLDTRRAKVTAYANGGAMAAMAGLATVALTGSGDPRFSIGANATLNSVAAIVLGGVALTGGIGSVVGAVAAAIIVFFLNPILSAMGIDPNTAQVIQGALIALVMMVAGLLELRRRRLE
ncbi:MAG TPA: ABC transporter permease [Acidimicrobiia bacterium]|jgi:ribose transport system permease protein